MKELSDIVQAYDTAKQSGVRMALATVVQVDGSSYRRPGARMLVTEDGQLTGAISGGCLEGDALRKAILAITQGKKKLVVYDTTDEDDAKLGVQLGCNGIVQILFEPIENIETNIIALFRQINASRQPQLLLTGFHPSNGEHLGSISTAALPSELKTALLPVFDRVLTTKISEHHLVDWNNTTQSIFVEYAAPAISLIIVGAGNDTIPLASMAHIIGWRTTIVDGRPTHATANRFKDANQIIIGKPPIVLPQLVFDDRTAIVLMTHNYHYDIEMLALLANHHLSYIGLLGPATKKERLLHDLFNQGIALDDQQLNSIHGPTGLDLGAETASEIALSICAEIMSVLEGTQPQSLKLKPTPIHAAL